MTRFTARIDAEFDVEIDESKVTAEVLEEFSAYITYVGNVEDLVEYLANLYARGVIDGSDRMIEGLGLPSAFGLKFIGAHGATDFGMVNVNVDIERA
ncbi:hypothetical protein PAPPERLAPAPP_04680 [Brevundimonas phage vB_BpoS-Papperlapapp]|uniref:Uncharacterized protein n=2 Tax=Marchewkavirus TaxID=3425052 RepID=A0A9E7SLU1_9CAUD|nr:hypothetical protein KABACHOK_03060 [Brevundimonas phage vB_BpoS-Kabachok]USN14837.1 hypothetical protein DOMOVOI_03630 [Brevundimonas phage vB_BpoS-Domovoi]USN16209.1 hypothetical protein PAPPERLAPAPP_04680 [Brevundimonas phage vB_BpoS-Papperlapapp]